MAGENNNSDRSSSVAEELCSLLGLPPPEPFTEEEEAAYQKWLDGGDQQVDAMEARRERAV